MARDWTRDEVDAAVADYFGMLERELQGVPFSKAEQRRTLVTRLQDRSEQSVEYKHANISAVLIELGFPYIAGYKPRLNYQQLLRDVVEERLLSAPNLLQLAAQDAERVPDPPPFEDILTALTAAPRAGTISEDRRAHRPYPPGAARLPVNYLELEARNRPLGLAGEEFVLAYERARLVSARQERLASQVEHVSHTRGDGLGYDILSYEATGADRLIEVKTTKYGAETPFFLTSNEVAVSESRATAYHLYRVFDFRERLRLFLLPGALRTTCRLEPATFIARVA